MSRKRFQLRFSRQVPRGIEHRLSEAVNASGRMLLRARKLPKPPESIKELMREKGDDIFHAEISNWKLIEQMLELAANSPIPAYLKRMNLRLHTVEPAESFFVTSDNPVVLYDAAYDPRSPYGNGFAHKTIEVTIPLNERMLVMFRYTDEFPKGRLSPDQTRHFNQRIIVSASVSFIRRARPTSFSLMCNAYTSSKPDLGHRPLIMEMVPLSFRRLSLLQIFIYKPRANQRMETNP